MGRARRAGGVASALLRSRFWRAVLGLLALGVAGHRLLLVHEPRTEDEARARLASLHPVPSDLSVLLVTVDTLRADRLGCYGFTGIETPTIDSLAAEGVLFENETAVAPLTLPSHASILSGLLPTRHGIRDNGGFFLDDEVTTLAERFAAAGYATGAFVGAWVLEGRWGLAQGFGHYQDEFDLSSYRVLSLGTVQKRGDEVVDGALEWLTKQQGRRFFAWVHLYDPHTPYEPPEPYRSRYAGNPYLGEVAATDGVVGRLMAFLREKHLLERTIVVLTSDHGESLGDHGEQTHGLFLYDSVLRVPLVIRAPWGLRGRVGGQTTSVDLFPTLLDLAGLSPEPGIDGISQARLLFDSAQATQRLAYSETYFPRYHFGWQHLTSIRDGRFKFVNAPTPELYDLTNDPGETTNVYRSWSKQGEDLRRQLATLAGEDGVRAPERRDLDPETLQRLAALGYVGSAEDVDPAAVLADPKEKLEVYRRMGEARVLAQNGRLDDAIGALDAVLASDPGMADGWTTLGHWLARLGKPERAATAFERALELDPRNDVALLNLAHLHLKEGRHGAALDLLRTVLATDPENAQVRYQLATVLMDLDRTDEARKELETVTSTRPGMSAAWNAQGALAFRRGDLASARRLVTRALELDPRVRFGAFNLGRILEAEGRLVPALDAYRKELRVFPDHAKARFNLAQILRAQGDSEGFVSELRRSTEESPDFGPAFFFLARAELELGRLDQAAALARRGLVADPTSAMAPLAHYVLADVYSRRGRSAAAEEALARGRALEKRAQRQKGESS